MRPKISVLNIFPWFTKSHVNAISESEDRNPKILILLGNGNGWNFKLLPDPMLLGRQKTASNIFVRNIRWSEFQPRSQMKHSLFILGDLFATLFRSGQNITHDVLQATGIEDKSCKVSSVGAAELLRDWRMQISNCLAKSSIWSPTRYLVPLVSQPPIIFTSAFIQSPVYPRKGYPLNNHWWLYLSTHTLSSG